MLIVRLDAIGDALALAPLLLALREAGVATDIVLSAANRDLYTAKAARNRFVAPFAIRDSSATNRALIDAFARELRPFGYTHVLVATEEPVAYQLAVALGARNRIGFSNGWGKLLKSLWVRTHLTQTLYRSAGLDSRGLHECEVLFALGTTLLSTKTRPSRDASAMQPLLLEKAPLHNADIALQLTSKWERLGFTVPDVRDLIERLRGEHATVRLLAPSAERESIVAFVGNDPEVVWFEELRPWMQAIGEARVLIAPDSGAIHVAGILGTPCVAVFPSGPDFALQCARWRPWAAPSTMIEGDSNWVDATVAAVEPTAASGAIASRAR
ncbi:MAG TPA: hypothetical protein VMV73_00100 [Candidatus Dormibacteraeota bacterium]|nr:hypothetical protein [Candidatus Dormibacteraeota bacterium]